MLYSGVDLIRSSGQQNERLERLNTAEIRVEPVAATPPAPEAPQDEGTKAALLRFARFVNKEGEKKKQQSPPRVSAVAVKRGDPYRAAVEHQQVLFERGKQIDIYI